MRTVTIPRINGCVMDKFVHMFGEVVANRRFVRLLIQNGRTRVKGKDTLETGRTVSIVFYTTTA